MPDSFEARLQRLEQRPVAKRGQWRGIVAAHFSGPEFAGHRQAIIDALTGDGAPEYSFKRQVGNGLVLYHLSFWRRETGGEPRCRTVRLDRFDDIPLPPGA